MNNVVQQTGKFSAVAVTTTDSYATLLTIVKGDTLTGVIVAENEGGTNAAHVKVTGGIEGDEEEILAETSVAAGAKQVIHVSKYYPKILVQIKAAVGGSQTDVSVVGQFIAV